MTCRSNLLYGENSDMLNHKIDSSFPKLHYKFIKSEGIIT